MFDPMIHLKKLPRMAKKCALFSMLFLLLASCQESKAIISNIQEREANVILVFLESKGIKSTKTKAATSGTAGAGSAIARYDIFVSEQNSIAALSILNSNGLPQRTGTTLLDLFAKGGLTSSEKEETIRYQAGLSQQVTNFILMIDGVIDASCLISWPTQEDESSSKKITASVFVKHQGIIEDPNSHLESKIKRLVSGAINGLDINDVTIVSDRSRFTDLAMDSSGQILGQAEDEYVKIWSITMNKESAGKFRFLFFLITFFVVLFALLVGYLVWKMYPLLKAEGGFKEILSPVPLFKKKKSEEEEEEEGL